MGALSELLKREFLLMLATWTADLDTDITIVKASPAFESNQRIIVLRGLQS